MMRCSGRTHRMLEAAVQAKREGRHVVVVAANSPQAYEMLRRPVSVGALSTRDFLLIYGLEDRMRGRSRDTMVFVDHFAWDQPMPLRDSFRLMRVLSMYELQPEVS